MHYKPVPVMFVCAMLGMIAAPLLMTAGPLTEGSLLPVVTDFQIKDVRTAEDGRSYIYGAAIKQRECTFDRTEWYLLDGSSIVRVHDFNLVGKAKSEEIGAFEWGPWAIGLTEHEIRTKTVSYVFHSCHPLWLTRTKQWGDTAKEEDSK